MGRLEHPCHVCERGKERPHCRLRCEKLAAWQEEWEKQKKWLRTLRSRDAPTKARQASWERLKKRRR